MKSSRIAMAVMICSAAALFANPGVKTVKTSNTKFHGFLGTMMKMSGGNQAQNVTTYLEGSRMRSDNAEEDGKLASSNIIDLDREVMINLDHKKKEYTEMTFAEFKAMMARMKEKMAGMQPQAPQGSAEVKMEYDFKVNRTGEKQNIAGFNTEKIIFTMEAKGENQAADAPAAKGGMVITSTQWLAKDAPGKAEAIAFGQRFGEKMGLAMGAGGAMNQWQALAAFNPQLAKAIEKLSEEGKKMEGVSVKSASVFETWSDPAQTGAPAANGEKAQELPPSVGGLLGGLGKKMAAKPKEGSAPGRSVMFESSDEIKEITTGSFGAELFSTPAGYKKVERKM